MLESRSECSDRDGRDALLQGAAAGHRVVRHGVVFGAFMTWNMLGAQLCKRLLASSGAGTQPETLVGGVIVASGCALLLPVFTTEFSVRIGGFCIFEAAIGAYWPLIMKLRSDHLGEEQRAAVTSLFRVPLNGVVCLVLLRAGAPSLPSAVPLPPHPRPAGQAPSSAFARLVCAGVLSLGEEFSLCVCFLGVALVCQQMVSRALQSPLSPAATKRRALAAGRSPAKPMETLLLPVPSVRPRPPINCARGDSLILVARAGRARSINRGKPLGRGRAPGSNERVSAATYYVCRPGQCIRRPLRTS